MSSISSPDHTKKRKADGNNAAGGVSFVGPDHQGEGLARELMSAMHELLDQNRSMETKIDRMEGEVKSLRKKCDTMERSLQSMDDNAMKKLSSLEADSSAFRDHADCVEKRQKYHEIILQNQKWEYAAPFPSNAANNLTVKRFLGSVESATCDMRYGKSDGTISIVGGAGLDDDAAFLPHWMEFATALEEYQYALQCLPGGTETGLNIGGVEFQNEFSFYCPMLLNRLTSRALACAVIDSGEMVSNLL